METGTDLGTYVVQEVDTLAGIAVKFNLTLATLKKLNRIYSPSQVYPGLVHSRLISIENFKKKVLLVPNSRITSTSTVAAEIPMTAQPLPQPNSSMYEVIFFV